MFLQVEIILISKLLVTTKLKNYVMYFVHFKKNHTHTKKKNQQQKKLVYTWVGCTSPCHLYFTVRQACFLK